MVRIHLTQVANRLDSRKVSKTFLLQVERAWRRCIRAFLEDISMQGIIHVDTGMSKASLLPLARAVGMLGAIRSTIQPVVSSRKGSYTMGGKYRSSPDRTMAEGEAAGENAFKIQYGTVEHPQFLFSFEIQVYQYFLHEIGAGGKHAWNSIERGRNAFMVEWEKEAKKFSLTDAIMDTL